uniref:Uncharacterized protein n=1 Tax=Glossina austeni TaxID=7395 RepID=A0A1A9VYA5_GLOAU
MFNVARQLKIVLTTGALENVPEISNAWLADICDLSWKVKKNYFIMEFNYSSRLDDSYRMRISLIYVIARNFYRPYDDAAPDHYYAEPKAVHRQALRVLKYWSHSYCADYDATMCGGDGVNVDDLVHHYRSLLIHFRHPMTRAASDGCTSLWSEGRKGGSTNYTRGVIDRTLGRTMLTDVTNTITDEVLVLVAELTLLHIHFFKT